MHQPSTSDRNAKRAVDRDDDSSDPLDGNGHVGRTCRVSLAGSDERDESLRTGKPNESLRGGEWGELVSSGAPEGLVPDDEAPEPVPDGEPGELVREIERTTLPGNLAELVDEYEETIGIRDRFLWKWLYYLFPEIQLSCVPDEHAQTVRDGKLLASLYVVLLDDVAEVESDQPTFQEAAKVPLPGQVPDIARDGVDSETVELATRIWECVDALWRTGPRSEAFHDLLVFDVHQTISAIWYSYLMNQHLELASPEETVRYDSYNMMLFPYADLDLIYSGAFDETELAPLRRVVRRAQLMARIGNWITTWERELAEGDFSSGVVVSALERGVVSRDRLRRIRDGESPAEREAVRRRIRDANVEEGLLDRWYACYRDIERRESAIRSVDVGSYLDAMETVLACHLASRGLK